MDELVSDLQLFSQALSKLGYAKQAKEVDLLTSSLLFGLQVEAQGPEAVRYQRKALLIKAKALVAELQAEVGNTHPSSHALALIGYELKNEIQE